MRFVKWRCWCGILLAFLLHPHPFFGLSNNNLRVDRFKWVKMETDHFDIYYDKKTEPLLPRMAHYLEEAWSEVGKTLNYEVPKKTPFFFFSNHNRFEQTNVVSIGEGTGGVTEAFKNRFLIFNDGSEGWMKHVIYHEFAHVVQFNVLYGGFWKSVRLLKSPFYPLWLMEGMAEFASSKGKDALGDILVRDALYNKNLVRLPELQGFNHLKPNQVTLAYQTGHAAMAFLADEYGADKVPKLLISMKDHFDVSSALLETIGSDLSHFDFRFHEWLEARYTPVFKRAKIPSHYAEDLTKSDGLPQFNHSPVVSSDGKYLYFLSDRNGPTRLYKYTIENGKSESLLGEKWSRFENIHTKGRSLSLSHDDRYLAFAGEKKQRDHLYLYDLKKRKLKRVKIPFGQIRSPIFSPVDNRLVCVGMKNGFNDLYVINKEGRLLTQLTDNPQDERGPVFSPDANRVIFSGEVVNEKGTEPEGRDLFEINIAGKERKRITKMEGGIIQPIVLPDDSLLFVRSKNDKNEVGFNLYHFDPSTTNLTQLTDLIGGAFSPMYHQPTDKLFFVGYHSGERHIYQTTLSSLRSSLSTSTAKTEGPLQLASLDSSMEPKEDGTPESLPSDQKEEILIDNNWGNPPKRPKKENTTRAITSWPDNFQSPLFRGPVQPYRFKVTTDIFLPFFFYSSLDGLVAADVWQISDLLGNHQVQQQMQYSSGSDFLDVSVFYTYAGLRPQFTFGFRNEQFFRDINRQRQRRRLDAIGIMSYPLDRVNSLTLGVGASDREDLFLDGTETDFDRQDRFWVAGLIHDSVTGRYLIPTSGRRVLLFYQEGLDKYGGRETYKTRGAEAVQYIRLKRESTLASRLFYGRSVGGNDAQVFRLGGVDRIRAVSRSSLENKKTNVLLGSGELRLRIKYLNWRTKFLFPDFFFKAAYLVLFDDVGYGWDNRQERKNFGANDLRNTAGVGLSWPTFILQTFQLNFTVQWAKRTDTSQEIWYITIGPTF